MVGFLIGSVLYIGALFAASFLLNATPSNVMPLRAWMFGLGLGVVMPAIANVVPIRRALSSVLRDALDMYHQVSPPSPSCLGFAT